MSEDEKKCSLSCSECAVRNCYRREKQYPAFCLTEEYKDAVELTRRLYESDGIDGRLARAAAEIEGEYYGRLTRLEETIRFAMKLGVKKLGIASCWTKHRSTPRSYGQPESKRRLSSARSVRSIKRKSACRTN